MLAVSLILLALGTPPASLQPVSVDLYAQLYNSGYSTEYTWMVRRNSSGSRVYLYEWPKADGILVVERGQVVKRIGRPAQVAYLNDQEQFVAWTDDLKRGISFNNGSHRDVASMGSFDVDPGGRYFVICTPETNEVADPKGNYVKIVGGASEIAAISQPLHILARS